jgi:hypothetical protein
MKLKNVAAGFPPEADLPMADSLHVFACPD